MTTPTIPRGRDGRHHGPRPGNRGATARFPADRQIPASPCCSSSATTSTSAPRPCWADSTTSRTSGPSRPPPLPLPRRRRHHRLAVVPIAGALVLASTGAAAALSGSPHAPLYDAAPAHLRVHLEQQRPGRSRSRPRRRSWRTTPGRARTPAAPMTLAQARGSCSPTPNACCPGPARRPRTLSIRLSAELARLTQLEKPTVTSGSRGRPDAAAEPSGTRNRRRRPTLRTANRRHRRVAPSRRRIRGARERRPGGSSARGRGPRVGSEPDADPRHRAGPTIGPPAASPRHPRPHHPARRGRTAPTLIPAVSSGSANPGRPPATGMPR